MATVTIETSVQAPLELVWKCWTSSEHIVNWNFASPEWCCPAAHNNLVSGGELNWRMEARDGSMGFDFTGVYKEVKEMEFISVDLTDGRLVEISFTKENNKVKLIESFETEEINSIELQRAGWQSILNNFKSYVESLT